MDRPSAKDTLPALRLPSFFSDNMVLQRGKPPRVWGWAPSGAVVAVQIAGRQKTATTNAHGKWLVELEPLPADTASFEMVVRCGSETRVIRNILAGEVWLCAGQSNMAWPLHDAAGGVEAIRNSTDPNLRFFVTAFHAPDQPADDCEGAWVECDPRTSVRFSGVAYFFGRQLRQELQTPVGLILSAQGATAAECWLSREALRSHPALQPIADNLATRVIDPKGWDLHLPSGLFHGRIAPLARFPIRGVIWYQGETNTKRAWQYRTLFPLLIADWWKAWGEELPFHFVQLANFDQPSARPVNETWAELREAQMLALQLPATGMAVTIDLGEETEIHPKNKQDVGMRLAALALARTYGRKGVDSGPLYRSMSVEGNQVRLTFDSIGTGLNALGGPLCHFAVAGTDKTFVWADAIIDGDAVVVSSPHVPHPIAVRYAWANNPAGCNLYNKNGFPASPFRTDNWPGVTDTAHLMTPRENRTKPLVDRPLFPSAGLTGNTLNVDLTATIERSWDQLKANGYRYGPRQQKEPNGDIILWLPYGNERGLYHDIQGLTLTDTRPGAPASLVYESGGHPGHLSFKFHFSSPISGFRLSSPPLDLQADDAVTGFEYSMDGNAWHPFHETATGLHTHNLHLRCYVRGKTNPEVVPAGIRLKAVMAGDVMWGDAEFTFAHAQWKLWVTPRPSEPNL
ncbi:MAG: sialate O-acetylesterase [Rariglobus sp.]|nr:sialate O-acetylesterase [Rariglobus sp.]